MLKITEIAQDVLRYILGDPHADWLRHLAGLTCHREVVAHEFVPGNELGYSRARCVWLPSVTADWCRAPRRCHALAPGRDHREKVEA